MPKNQQECGSAFRFKWSAEASRDRSHSVLALELIALWG
jgi:hypothetical protein